MNRPLERFRRKVYATVGFFLVLTVWEFLAADIPWSRGVFLSTLSFALILPAIFQSILRYL